MKLNSRLLIWVLGLPSLANAQEVHKDNVLGDYYLHVGVHYNYNFNSYEVHNNQMEATVSPVGKTKNFTLGIGWRLRNADYLTIDIGRYNTRSDHEVEYTIPRPPNFGYLKHVAPGVRIGYERYFRIWKNLSLTGNAGIFSYMVNFNQALRSPISPYYFTLSGDASMLFGPSLSLNAEWNVYKRFSVFVKTEGHYIINSNKTHSLEIDDLLSSVNPDISVVTKPYTFQLGVGLKYSVEHKSFFKKKTLY